MKAMVGCGWGQVCSKAYVSFDHRKYDAVYAMEAGQKDLCVAGRSMNAYVDKVCVGKVA